MAKRILLVVLAGLLLSGCSNMMRDFMQAADRLFHSESRSDRLAGGSEGVYRSKVARASDVDKDGIADGRDECANTPAGVVVDSFGCPVQLYLRVTMEYGKQTLEPDAYGLADVDRIGRLLAENPLARAVIEGHTDNRGSARENMLLSQQRAEVLKNWIVRKYHVAPERISAQGYGAVRPMVSNATEQGRRRNRRAVITLNGYYKQELQYVALGDPLDVHFATGRSVPTGAGEYRLKELIRQLRRNPKTIVSIDGHTDSVGNPQSNLLLSQERARSVKAYLVQKYKVSPDRLQTNGYGDTRPIADNATESGRFQNRRVTITLKKPAPAGRRAKLTANGYNVLLN